MVDPFQIYSNLLAVFAFFLRSIDIFFCHFKNDVGICFGQDFDFTRPICPFLSGSSQDEGAHPFVSLYFY